MSRKKLVMIVVYYKSMPESTPPSHKESQTPLDWCEQFVNNFQNRGRELTEAEKRLHEEARGQLRGLLPQEFYRGALKQTAYGVGVLALQSLFAPTGIGYLAVSLAGGLFYEDNVKTQGKKHPEMQFLEAEDWLGGVVLNPVLVGGIRNIWKARQTLMNVDRKLYATAPAP